MKPLAYTRPPSSRFGRDTLLRNLRRLQARRPSELLGRLALRLWPVSIAANRLYASKMAPARHDATNRKARQLFRTLSPELDAVQQAALDDLRSQGVHQTDVRTLPGPAADFSALRREAAALLDAPDIQRQIVARRSRHGVKWYVVRAFGFHPSRCIPPAIAGFVLHDRIIDLVNSYLGLASRLIYLDLWYNLPVGPDAVPVDSEYWHRDGEDRNTVKLFLYLSQVDGSAGPLSYLRESHPGGRYGLMYPNRPPRGSYPSQADLDATIPCEQRKIVEGEPGTLTLYDGCGLHCGGRATGTARLVLVATYASDAAFDQQRYRLQDQQQIASLGDAARYAIRA